MGDKLHLPAVLSGAFPQETGLSLFWGCPSQCPPSLTGLFPPLPPHLVPVRLLCNDRRGRRGGCGTEAKGTLSVDSIHQNSLLSSDGYRSPHRPLMQRWPMPDLQHMPHEDKNHEDSMAPWSQDTCICSASTRPPPHTHPNVTLSPGTELE